MKNYNNFEFKFDSKEGLKSILERLEEGIFKNKKFLDGLGKVLDKKSNKEMMIELVKLDKEIEFDQDERIL
jgi:hypothetical protein